MHPYELGKLDYTELQCMVYRNRHGIYVWNMSIEGMTTEEARAWGGEYIAGWRAAQDRADAALAALLVRG